MGGTSDGAGLPSQQQLAAQAAAGDPAALQTLLLQHHDRLSAMISKSIPRALQSTISADDVCQDAYAAAFLAVTEFTWDGEDSFYSWLRTIATRRLADAIRRQTAAKRGGSRVGQQEDAFAGKSTVDLLVLVARNSTTPSRLVTQREACEEVEAALQRLSPDHRLALRLRYFDGLTAAEAGGRMGRTPQAIQMLCARALAELEMQLGDPAKFFSRFA